jgi:osmotically-inducible protein OsmY
MSAGTIVGPEWRLTMNALMKAAGWDAPGAAGMYFHDPQAGRRRRALARDRGTGAVRELEHSARTAGRDASNRMRGAMAEAKSHIEAAPVDDDTLHERIRAKLGHLLDRPSAVEVTVTGGHVTLSGEASDEDAAEVARYVAGMQGVSDVESRLASRDPEAPDQGSARH